MRELIKLIGYCMVAIGCLILVNPKITRRMMAFWRTGNNLYIGGLIRIVLGTLLVYYAPQSRVPMLTNILGALALLGGVLLFVVGLDKTKAMLGFWDKKPDNFLRLISILALAFGGLIIYTAY